MIEVSVDPGICGMPSVIKIESEDGQVAKIEFRTQCPNLKPLETELTEADAFTECFGKPGQGEVYALAGKYCRHASCPVPCAILKGIEAACDLALPNDAVIRIMKD